MELKENQIVFIDENGDEVLCEILFTYSSEETGYNYVFFFPVGSEDEDGKVEIGVARYNETENGTGELEPVNTDEEWEMLEEVFEAYANEQESCGCGCGCDCDCDEECDCEEEECGHEGCCCHNHK